MPQLNLKLVQYIPSVWPFSARQYTFPFIFSFYSQTPLFLLHIISTNLLTRLHPVYGRMLLRRRRTDHPLADSLHNRMSALNTQVMTTQTLLHQANDSVFTDFVQMMHPLLIACILLILCRRETMICSGRCDSERRAEEGKGPGDEDPEAQWGTKTRTQLIMGLGHQSLSSLLSVCYHPSTGLTAL